MWLFSHVAYIDFSNNERHIWCFIFYFFAHTGCPGNCLFYANCSQPWQHYYYEKWYSYLVILCWIIIIELLEWYQIVFRCSAITLYTAKIKLKRQMVSIFRLLLFMTTLVKNQLKNPLFFLSSCIVWVHSKACIKVNKLLHPVANDLHPLQAKWRYSSSLLPPYENHKKKTLYCSSILLYLSTSPNTISNVPVI